MSYHIKLKEYNCPNCNALYIPYKENMACPSCKTIPVNTPKEYLGFIDELIASLRVNKIREGRYIPSAWYTGSFTEYIQGIIFHLFDALDKDKSKNVELFISEYLGSMKLDKDDNYLKNYIYSLSLEIYSRKSELRISFWTKLVSKLLP